MKTDQQSRLLDEVLAERGAQDREHGGPAADDRHSPNDWLAVLVRHLGLAGSDRAETDPRRYRRQLVRVAATALAALESFDRLHPRERAAGAYTQGSGA